MDLLWRELSSPPFQMLRVEQYTSQCYSRISSASVTAKEVYLGLNAEEGNLRRTSNCVTAQAGIVTGKASEMFLFLQLASF